MEENKYKKVEDIIVKRASKKGSVGVYKGVTPAPNNRFTAQFCISNGRKSKFGLNLGIYNTPEEAYIARLKFIDSLK